MPKFMIEVEYDDEEDIKSCNQTYEEIVYEALRDYNFDTIRVEEVGETLEKPAQGVLWVPLDAL